MKYWAKKNCARSTSSVSYTHLDVYKRQHVDLRYMHWLMEKVYPAPHLLREMGL